MDYTTDLAIIYEHSPGRLKPEYATADGELVAERFHKDWAASYTAPPRPFVTRILRIPVPPNIERFDGLRFKSNAGIIQYGIRPPNKGNRSWKSYHHMFDELLQGTAYRYHCTTRGRGCDLGIVSKLDGKVNQGFCKPHIHCPLCSIFCKGFDASRAGDYGKLGGGIYTTASSLKADRYLSSSTDVQHKAMIMAWVNRGVFASLMTKSVQVTTKKSKQIKHRRITIQESEKLKAKGKRSLEGVPAEELRLNKSAAYSKIFDHNIFSHPESCHFHSKDVVPVYLIIYENHEWAKHRRY